MAVFRGIKSCDYSKSCDYMAMDIKAPPEKYSAVAGVKVDMDKIRESISLIMGGNISYNFGLQW